MLGNASKCAVLVVLLLSLCVAFASAAPAGAPARTAAASVPFERLKSLAGDWVAAEDGEMFKKGDVVSRYSVTASGSAVVETVFPGSPHEMVTSTVWTEIEAGKPVFVAKSRLVRKPR